ncbi:MAG TPA: DUF3859 domain-containing protein [Thermoanaerobaculia bacterium]
MRLPRVSGLLLCGLLAACATARQPRVTAEILGAGATVTTHVRDVAAPHTSSGHVHEVPAVWTPEFLPGGTAVQARLGTSMGIEVQVKGAPLGSIVTLRTRVTHPPLTNPATRRTTTRDEWTTEMNALIPRYAGWAFAEPWELVPGRWTIELLQGDRTIASQDFEVTVAADGR